MSFPNEPPMSQNSCTVSAYGDETIEFLYKGNIGVHIMEQAYADYQKLHKKKPEKYQLVDVLDVQGLEPQAVDIIGKVLGDFRAGGGKIVVMAATASFAKMMGSSMSFSAGTSLKLFESRAEAIRQLRQLTGKKA